MGLHNALGSSWNGVYKVSGHILIKIKTNTNTFEKFKGYLRFM